MILYTQGLPVGDTVIVRACLRRHDLFSYKHQSRVLLLHKDGSVSAAASSKDDLGVTTMDKGLAWLLEDE